MTIRGVIFDLDGTIADTLPDIASAVNFGLRSYGLPPRPIDEVKLMVGEGMPTLCERALIGHPEIPVADMIQKVSAHYRDHRLDQAAPFDGIPELFDGLADRKIPMAILTNKPHAHTIPMVVALFGRWKFAAIEGYQEESRRKPDPRTALEIVQRMQATPDQVIMVGDSKTDIQTAINAELIAVGVTWGYRPREELIEAGAVHLIHRPPELLSLV